MVSPPPPRNSSKCFRTHGDLVYFEISSKSFRRRRPGILLSVSEPMVILCTLKFLLSFRRRPGILLSVFSRPMVIWRNSKIFLSVFRGNSEIFLCFFPTHGDLAKLGNSSKCFQMRL